VQFKVRPSQVVLEIPISKTLNIKRTGRVAQVIECLPNKHEALSSNISITKKKKKKISPGIYPSDASFLPFFFFFSVRLFIIGTMNPPVFLTWALQGVNIFGLFVPCCIPEPNAVPGKE
jgi:hypothetical protein